MKPAFPSSIFWLALLLSVRAPAATHFTYDLPGNLAGVSQGAPGLPSISVPPASQVIAEDGNATFIVMVAGSGPLSFQWLSNGIPIPGATGDALVITNVIVPRNLVSNGSFELPQLPDDYQTFPVGSGILGWTIESGTMDLVRSTFWQPFDGPQSLDTSGTSAGAIRQDVTVVPGQAYYLHFGMAVNPLLGPTLKTNVVWWDGTSLDTNILSITGRSVADLGWTNREYLVTATSTTAPLRFVSLAASSAGLVLDDVSLVPVLPAPAGYSVIISNSVGSITSAVATVEFDLDENHLPDSWERTNFGSIGQSDAGDADGDGVSNRDEFLDATNPTNPASLYPRLNLAVSGNGTIQATPLQLSYVLNEVVPITATPDTGSTFIRWRGITNTSPSINLVMDGTKNLTAEFGLTMTNGAIHEGTILPGGTNTYAFAMNAGDTVIFRCGEVSGSASFVPWLRLYGLNGALLDSESLNVDAYVEYRATNSGIFSLTVNSTGSLQTGDYRLSFIKMPGAFVVSPGDEGGSLTNGANHDGATLVGDEDLWTFNATAGNTVVLRCGQLTGAGANGYYPYLRLYGPTGALLASVANDNDSYITYQTTNSGTFSVVVGSYYRGESGTYRLRLMQVPGAFVVPAGDEGGALTNGANHDGIVDLGDEDMWTFVATAGNNIILRCGQLTGAGPNGYYPYLRLYGPTGALLDTAADDNDAYIAYQTTNSGTFTVVVGSAYAGDNGSYRLRLVQAPGAFVVPSGDEGGPLINGGNHDGVIELGDEDIWTFTATPGNSIVLRCGQLTGAGPNGYFPYLRLYGPTGALLAANQNDNDTYIAYQTTNSGTFTVVVGSYYAGDNGSYRLRLVQVPGAFVIPSEDEGGALTSGGDHDGVIELGDEDIWTFTATPGNSIVLRCGQLTGAGPNGYFPYLRLYGPTGALLAANQNDNDTYIAYQTTNSGTFTVLVGTYYTGDTGTYRLRFARMPAAFIVPPDDQGGLLSPQISYDGTNDLGDEDLWSFTAYKGAPINLRVLKLNGAGSYSPLMRLYGSNGALLGNVANSAINYTPTNHGTFTVLIGSQFAGFTGSYRLSGTNISDGLKLSLTGGAGTNLNLGGSGGASNVSYLVYTTTNLAQPGPLWSLLVSNRFNASGAFSLSNLFNPTQREQYFRLVVP